MLFSVTCQVAPEDVKNSTRLLLLLLPLLLLIVQHSSTGREDDFLPESFPGGKTEIGQEKIASHLLRFSPPPFTDTKARTALPQQPSRFDTIKHPSAPPFRICSPLCGSVPHYCQNVHVRNTKLDRSRVNWFEFESHVSAGRPALLAPGTPALIGFHGKMDDGPLCPRYYTAPLLRVEEGSMA